jgi:hypothetical protein
MNDNKNKNSNEIRQVSIILVAVVASTVLALGSLAQYVSADIAVSGKITFLPWYGTGGEIVYLPPAKSGIETTTALLPPALVTPGLSYV